MSYLYKANISPRDRFDQVEILLDDGTEMTLRLGHSYDLTPSELARASRYIEIVSSDIPADDPTGAAAGGGSRIVTTPGEPVPSTAGLRPYTEWTELL